jgi:maleamate amidohydrolase
VSTGRPEGSDLHGDYRSAGFGGRSGFGRRPAVVVVDVCRAYTEPASPLYAGVEAAVASAARVVGAARESDVPVVFTYVRPEPGSAFARKVPSLQLLAPGSPYAEPVADPAPLQGEAVLLKAAPSAFFGTGLADLLHRDGVDTVVLVGLSTSGCVRASAVDAVSHGFRTVVVREAVGDRDPRPHEQALFDLDAKYADVVDEAEVLARMAGRPDAGAAPAPTRAPISEDSHA